MSQQLTFHVSPSPSWVFRETAIAQTLAFSDQGLTRWWSPTIEDGKIDTPDQIPWLRLYKLTRDHAHRELKPDTIVVCALIDGQIAGCAAWRMPKKLWRSESLMELLYRKTIELKDQAEDWMFPGWWVNPEKRKEWDTEQAAAIDRYLGPGKLDEMWYLQILGVHPAFQRKGVGAALLDWGLEHARERGEKVYLEASEFGRGLYLKKGFKIIGHCVVGTETNGVSLPCMLWDPDDAPSNEVLESQVGPVEKQA